MNPNLTLVLIIIYLGVIFFFTKYYKISKKRNEMTEIYAKCSDIVIRRTYNKKYYLYFYTCTIKKEEYPISDKLRLPIFQKKIVIGQKYLMYIDKKNPQNYLSPIISMIYKWYLFISITLIIISILLFL